MPHSINEAERILDKIMLYFSVVNYSELAKKIGVAQQNISKWKSRNSVNAIKIKCRELGIYNEIFGDFNSKSQYIGSITNSNISQNKIENQQIKEICNIDKIIDIDEATLSLFKEIYLKAKDRDKIKDFRIYLMEFNI
ncbi:hypothetical protein [Aliarcobacter cryaerophilus]|uniref:Bacteriophage CI repressor n=1 Tax=Aliarcobacter cryaerophilus TaxID=28198 RepID=A0AA46NL95_9BACT|nr:hypothetical protein [Aliarcobacter cryaerophilus]UYF42554.1 hypothetical protein NGX11_06480 [Aliarcobacter cryaerophilus]